MLTKIKLNISIILVVCLFMSQIINADDSLSPARINGDNYEVLIDGTWEQITIKGVNMGMAKPGTFPGEAGITYDEYFSWIEDIAKMNANVIRVYTLHPPDFYKALYDYNDTHDLPVYIMHGFWLDEDNMHVEKDAYNDLLLDEFETDAKYIIDAVHGNADIEDTPGKASGIYEHDVSQYVIGWIFGTEWDPGFVVDTNSLHQGVTSYDGTYYQTENTAPFETWIAKQLDFISVYEYDTYGSLRPMSFTNWVTTDILDHISDASDADDAVGVDPNVITLKSAMVDVGQFASYHIYPYYPEFLNHEPDYIEYIDHRGKKNNYAGYLNALIQVHDMPVLVAEFGVPASRGLTHRNPSGWNQGFLDEIEAGHIVAHLFEDIMHEGYLGGLVFTWQDEWFKRTWNTMDYDDPDRRPFWSNAQTNEQQFGILSFDTLKIKLDGHLEAWENTPMYQKSEGVLHSLRVDYDERYFYIRLDYDKDFTGQFKLPIDVTPNQGNTTLDEVSMTNGIEFYVDINDTESRVWVDDYYDFYNIQYGHQLEMIDVSHPLENNSGRYNPIFLTLNREIYLPHLEETLPFEYYETGVLKMGNANPDSPDYNSLNDYQWNKEDGWIEIRLPWLIIGAKDPSTRAFNGNIAEGNLDTTVSIDGIFLGAFAINDDTVVDSFPAISNGELAPMEMFTWETWDLPEFEPRLKHSYDVIKELFDKY